MSISYEIKNKLFRLPLQGAKKTVLLAYSEFADKDGGSIFPSHDLIATYAGITRQWVDKITQYLIGEGFLNKLTHYKNRSNLLCLNIPYINEVYDNHIKSLQTYNEEVSTQFAAEQTEFAANEEIQSKVSLQQSKVSLQQSKVSLHKRINNYQLTYNTYVQKISFSEKTEPIQNSKTPFLEEQIIIKPEKPVEVGKSYQQALPSSSVKTEKKTKLPKVNLEEHFEEWYKAYPKHEARKKGYEAFLKAWSKVEFDRLLELTKAYSRSVEGKDKQFLPLPASWLNGERWKDDSIAGYCLAKTTTQSQIPTQTQPVSDRYEPPINLDSPAAQFAFVDKNLGSFVKTFPHIDSASIFAEAEMLKFGDKITIYHKYAFCLNKMKIEEDRLMKFFNASTVEFTTEPLEEPSIKLVWPPKPETEKASMPEKKPEPYTPPVTEIKPPRYRTLNESYQGSTAQSLGANLNALQRSYQQKLQTTG